MGSTNSRIIKSPAVKTIDLSPPSNFQAKIGQYLYEQNDLEKKHQRRWEKYLTKNQPLSSMIHSFKESKFHKGFPQKYRWECWKAVLKTSSNIKDYMSIPMTNDYAHDIYKDLDRTFPEHKYFNKSELGYYGQIALKRILNKFAHKYGKIGYCQGMNFITGFLLMVSGGKEVEVFAFLEAFYIKYTLEDFYTEDMKGLKHFLWIFDKTFESKFCKLYWHFKNEDISEDMWVLKFFLTIFTSTFPIEITVFIWDLILLDGFENIYRVVLAFLKMNQEKILKLSTFELLQFLNSPYQWHLVPQILLKKSRKIRLSRDKRDSFEREYKSMPCPSVEYLEVKKETKSVVSSPKITVQLVTEEPPVLFHKNKVATYNGYRQIINPFIVESTLDKSFSDSGRDDSFNAEDVLNNLVSENDWDNLYIR
ncbi:hypothetical protein SteCoe_18284 [Stentor coeruleus]|uniref:Rab-GAP TBC domain-containing protein n=1 Tax=Stentor coeruleus TaxID=5963 RepID=A0A1R2BWY6_9CILI|nr:hypothetical protein SteCoe_18284 [Stentor coeruleus]